MSPLTKTLLGGASVLPIVSAVGLGCYLGYALIADDIARGSPMRDPITGLLDGPFDSGDLALFAVIVIAIALFELVLSVVFAVHAARDPRSGSIVTVIWIAALFLAGPIALPCYFALYILRDPTPKRDPALDHAPIAG